MARTNRQPHASVKVVLVLNPQEALAVDHLLESGLFGYTRSQTVRRLMDERLVQIYQQERNAILRRTK